MSIPPINNYLNVSDTISPDLEFSMSPLTVPACTINYQLFLNGLALLPTDPIFQLVGTLPAIKIKIFKQTTASPGIMGAHMLTLVASLPESSITPKVSTTVQVNINCDIGFLKPAPTDYVIGPPLYTTAQFTYIIS
jgi:hypothetical protein